MTLDWAVLALLAVLVVAGYGAGYLRVMRKVREVVAESQRELERRLQSLTEAVTMRHSGKDADLSSTDALDAEGIEAKPVTVIQGRPLPRIEIRNAQEASENEEIEPEIQAVIAAVAVVLLGNHARVRAARRVPSQDVVSPWTQQGRVIVQSSHNLRARGR